MVKSETPKLACRIHSVPCKEPEADDGYFAEVELVNCSESPQEIMWNHPQMERYTFVIRDDQGEVVAQTYLGDRYGFRATPATITLAPHEGLRTHFHFLVVIPKEFQRPGKYFVQAVFTDEHRRVESEPVEVIVR